MNINKYQIKHIYIIKSVNIFAIQYTLFKGECVHLQRSWRALHRPMTMNWEVFSLFYYKTFGSFVFLLRLFCFCFDFFNIFCFASFLSHHQNNGNKTGSITTDPISGRLTVNMKHLCIYKNKKYSCSYNKNLHGYEVTQHWTEVVILLFYLFSPRLHTHLKSLL